MLRDRNCGELNINDVTKDVTLCGWIASRRDHGEIIFMDLRDKHGVTQIVFDPEKDRQLHGRAHELRNEYCVMVKGKVLERPEGTVNPALPTGEIEVEVKSFDVLSEALTPPFEIKDDLKVSEELRLKYRYLDLRRPSMMRKLEIKSKIFRHITQFLDEKGFMNIETPMLTKSTPEGARDFLVPSRTNPGEFYALPQSPQIFKQILMVSGAEKYFQIVRCFRDEDLRADRQPEFTQLDMEMSFVEQEDILGVCEELFSCLFEKVLDKRIDIPFRRMTHAESMSLYGTDKPDTRFEMLLADLSGDVAGCEFKIFRQAVEKGGQVKAVAAPGCAGMSRKEIDDLTSYAAEYGAKGLAYFKVAGDGLESPVSKFFSREEQELFIKKTSAKEGDMIFMVADEAEVVADALSAVRLRIGKEKGLIDPGALNFLWVVDFPLFKDNKEEQKWVSEHHPFTSFREEDAVHLDSGDLGRIRSSSYDLVLNGSEIASGSIRIHKKDIQQKVFNALRLSEEECAEKFGFLLEAFDYGPPPHGGIAFGLDRIITLFTGDDSIREVIPFPKTQRGTCPLTSAPSPVDRAQLTDLGLRLGRKAESALAGNREKPGEEKE
jgi:aspartyl-tRNA synthetase